MTKSIDRRQLSIFFSLGGIFFSFTIISSNALIEQADMRKEKNKIPVFCLIEQETDELSSPRGFSLPTHSLERTLASGEASKRTFASEESYMN